MHYVRARHRPAPSRADQLRGVPRRQRGHRTRGAPVLALSGGDQPVPAQAAAVPAVPPGDLRAGAGARRVPGLRGEPSDQVSWRGGGGGLRVRCGVLHGGAGGARLRGLERHLPTVPPGLPVPRPGPHHTGATSRLLLAKLYRGLGGVQVHQRGDLRGLGRHCDPLWPQPRPGDFVVCSVHGRVLPSPRRLRQMPQRRELELARGCCHSRLPPPHGRDVLHLQQPRLPGGHRLFVHLCVLRSAAHSRAEPFCAWSALSYLGEPVVGYHGGADVVCV
mmetsp:Transcript_92937/g.248721  ORF Transcript_92937/g.248721 Transcript_92937/m.248721 type:complete len:276 (-) Transcript_92937:1327-2154(-)